MEALEACRISSIILTHNATGWIEQCLDSLLQSGVPRKNILIVDNASTDGTLGTLKKRYSDIRRIENSENLGFAAGCNVGIHFLLEEGYFTHIGLLNQDTVVEPNFYTGLMSAIDTHTGLAAFAPLQLSYDGKHLQRTMMQYILAPQGQIIDDFWQNNVEKVYPVEMTYGGALFFHADVFERIGFLDDLFFMYGEDLDFSRRLTRAGIPMFVVPGSQVRHWDAQTNKPTPNARRCHYLVELKNTDRRFISVLFSVYETMFGRFFHAVMIRNTSNLKIICSDMWWVLMKLKKVRKSRKNEI